MIRDRDGFLLVYSVTSRPSFEAVGGFVRHMRDVKGPGAVCTLVGNKCDLTGDRQVTDREGQDLARALGCDFIETSAKMAVNVEQIFVQLILRLRALRESRTGLDINGRPLQDNKGKRRKQVHCCSVM